MMGIFDIFKSSKPSELSKEKAIEKTGVCGHVKTLPIVMMSETPHDEKRTHSLRISCHLSTCWKCGDLTSHGRDLRSAGEFEDNKQLIKKSLEIAFKQNKKSTMYRLGKLKGKGKVIARLGEDTVTVGVGWGRKIPAYFLDWADFVDPEG